MYKNKLKRDIVGHIIFFSFLEKCPTYMGHYGTLGTLPLGDVVPQSTSPPLGEVLWDTLRHEITIINPGGVT